MEPGGVIFILFVVAALGMFGLWTYLWIRQVERWRSWVTSRRWEFLQSWPGMVRLFRGGPFGVGSGRRASLGFWGTFDGQSAGGFRYQYTTGSGKNRTTHHRQVLFVQIPGARFPRLELARETLLTRAFVRDVQFEDAEFNRMWDVRGGDPKFTHDVVHPRMMEFLKRLEIPEMETLWFEDDCLLVSVHGYLAPDVVDGYLRMLTRSLSHLPPFVLNQYASGRLELTWDGATPKVGT